MKLNKLITLITVAMLLCASAFGAVAVKDIGNGEVEITFTMKDDSVSELAVIGSFNDWTEPGDAMTKNANGEWEYVLKAYADDEITYKFFHSGNYIFDFRAPDKIDDGFGGNNGFIAVADLLADAGTPAPSTQTADATTGAQPPARSKFDFSTTTVIESDTRFDTDDGEFKPLVSNIDAKSIWKFEGDAVTGMPVFVELELFNASQTLWEDAIVKAEDGIKKFAGGMLFNPIHYFGGDSWTKFNAVEFGFDTKYVGFRTGIGSAKLPEVTSAIWKTIDKDASDGYTMFSNGWGVQTFGDFSVDAGLVLNKSLNSFYGLNTWARLGYTDYDLFVQYNMKSGTTTELKDIFKDIPRQEIIIGATAQVADFAIALDTLVFSYKKTINSTIDMKDRLAAQLNADYANEELGLEAGVYVKYRGYATKMEYSGIDDEILAVDISNKIGAIGIGANAAYMIDIVTPSLEVDVTMANKDFADNNTAIAFKPACLVSLDDILGTASSADVYAKLSYDTKPATDASGFNFNQVGLMFNYDFITAHAAMNYAKTEQFTTLVAEAEVIQNLKVQAGLGLRTAETAPANPFGFNIGVGYVLPAPAAKEPAVYAQFVFNMDPYDEYSSGYNLDGYSLDGGATKSDGETALKLGIKWDF
ncbi:MAG TPA: glycogen-binding domain-containing protein [Treponemataceae bacterium]|nr:glycogen-binding domain-containing protein [Treponemataceae bacterium]